MMCRGEKLLKSAADVGNFVGKESCTGHIGVIQKVNSIGRCADMGIGRDRVNS